MEKFKLSEQYYFGKLESGNGTNFVRTPKPQVYSGRDLKKRNITSFEDFYELNPCGFKEGDNISICVKNSHGTLEEKATKTILPPVPEKKEQYEGLSDHGVTPLHNNRSENKELVASYKQQIDRLVQQNSMLSEKVNDLSSTTIDQARELAEKDVELKDLEKRVEEAEAKYTDLWEEFGDLIKEARNADNATPSLGDRLGVFLADPEIQDVVKSGIVGLSGYLKDRFAKNEVPGLKDNPPSHEEDFSDDPEAVFE